MRPGPCTQLYFNFFVGPKLSKVLSRIPYNFQIYSYLLPGHILVVLAKWPGNVLITWARVGFIMPPKSFAIIYGGGPQVKLLVKLLFGHDNGTCSYRVLVVGACSPFDYQVGWSCGEFKIVVKN